MNKFLILTDTRQQKENHIIKEFDKQGILHIRTGLPSADYMAVRYGEEKGFYLDYSILIDTKKDLLELCNNMTRTTEHQRVVREVELGQSLNCKRFIFLVGDNSIKSVEDIKKWSNKHTKIKGETLLKILTTFKQHHNCEFMIVPKNKMGETIIKLLSNNLPKDK